MCKGLGIIVNVRLNVRSHLNEKRIEFKNILFKGLVENLQLISVIPDFFGIGKNASHGYGTVKRIKELEHKKSM